MELLQNIYHGWNDLMENKSDQRVRDWPLMSSPFPTIAICLTYAYFVKVRNFWKKYINNNNKMTSLFIYFLQVLGPKLMENRKPFKLRFVLIIYNAIQVVFSSWLFYEACVAGWTNGYSWRCQPVDYSNTPRAIRVISF